MGYSLNRFKSEIDDELKCSICCGVLEDPIQSQKCQHVFCRKCITQWLSSSKTCPSDCNPLCLKQLEPIPRIVRNILNRLQIRCDFFADGCDLFVNLEDLEIHKKQCSFNPEFPLPCSKKCGAMIPKSKMSNHDCVQDLRLLIIVQQKEIESLRKSLATMISASEEQKKVTAQNDSSLVDLSIRYENLKSLLSNLEKSIQEIVQFTTLSPKETQIELTSQALREKVTQETTIEIYISNVDRHVTPTILQQFLLNQSINVISFKEAINRGWKIDFRVTIFKSDYHKILSPKLWPEGVTCFVCGDYYSTKIEGSREFDQTGSDSMLKAFVQPKVI